MTKRIRAIAGGTSASKTISVLLYLIAKAQSDTTPTLTSVVSESFPHLKRGSIRDFLNIMQEHGYFKDTRWNKTDYTYTFETGSKIEFFSADQPSKVRGPRRDRLFVNEGNNVNLESWEQLLIRTKEFAFIDWNPVTEFYMYTDYINKREDVDFIVLTYKDNEALAPSIVFEIESRKNNKAWWQVYGQGLLGEVEGRIYKDWQIIDEIPHEAQIVRRGLDFGFSIDPSTVVDLYKYNGGYIATERLYRKGMFNNDISAFLNNLDNPNTLVIADSSEPKSIADIAQHGVPIIGVIKKGMSGKSYLKYSIEWVQQQKISVTKSSTNLLREYRGYLWMTDKDGKSMNEPTAGNDHCFAPETLIYTTIGKKRIDSLVGQNGYLYSRDGKIKRFTGVRETRKDAEVVSIEFDDKQILTVTPDHLLLQDNGAWIEAGLLCPLDMIQSGTYEYTHAGVQGKNIQALRWGEILQSWTKKIAQSCVGILQRQNTYGLSYSPQRSRRQEQLYRQPRDQDQTFPLERTHDSRKTRKTKDTRSQDTPTNKEMAFIKRGKRVACASWSENNEEQKTIIERLRSLPCKIREHKLRYFSKILQPELQNESPTKTVKRITRGFRAVTYNLEVEGTHCLVANGVIAHNCLDALRYAFDGLRPRDDEDELATTGGADVRTLFY